MSTWFALHLPALPLQLAERALDPAFARSCALAIADGPVQRSKVAFCNSKANAAGVAAGMKLAAAQALARDLIAIERDVQKEQQALQDLACWAYQFSAQIVPFQSDADSGLLLETGASERLFGGHDALRRRIVEGLRRLGFRGADASAATPAAARVLARARADGCRTGDAKTLSQLRASVGRLPLQLLAWDEASTRTLLALGLHTIEEILALPRDAFARRFGARRLVELDRLLGTIADPQPPFLAPERFAARVELPADLIEVARLLPPLRHLLLLLEGFLRGKGMGATALQLRAHHSARRDCVNVPTPIDLALASPERDVARLLQLFTERMARVHLRQPAVELELRLERMDAWQARNASFLPPAPHVQGVDALQLAETLHARLGSEGVFQLQALGDHRPEYAYRVLPLTPDPPVAQAPAPPPTQRPMLLLTPPQPLHSCTPVPHAEEPAVDDSRPLYGGPLALLAGPERIEAGWWDLGYPQRATVHRDYFVARNPRGQTLWIFRELAAPRRWFLHGFFS
jgi:protein ImuB